MVQTGVLRAFGSELRHLLSKALGNRVAAFAAGLGLTALLQSSTATALMTASFTAQGFVGLVPGLTILLGANTLGPRSSSSFSRSTGSGAEIERP
jgi:phosphate:Na+ symporter